MESNYINYDYLKSFARIDEILSESDNSFPELSEMPSRDKLTFNNGFYVNCSCLVVDIRDSSNLPNIHNRPKLAKIYRSYISEAVSIMNGNSNCAEISIIGDGISGIFKTPNKSDIDNVFATGYTISSLIDVLNYKFKKHDIQQINVGIGISDGRALMIKAGYKGSSINELVWMGDVVNEAHKLASFGNKTRSDKRIMASNDIYINLNEDNKKLLEWNQARQCYNGNIGRSDIIEWYNQNCL
ncbi:MAG: adenylate/guanylate cyclase domain-containing protein [Methanothrix sp.]|nr:adenylate/guanylate cyclase domain-containing protein [Methanothrix sp.]